MKKIESAVLVANALSARAREGYARAGRDDSYTSTGVRPPWVTEQQTAPAKANLEYRARPLSFWGAAALTFSLMASTLVEPVEVGGAVPVADIGPGMRGVEMVWTGV